MNTSGLLVLLGVLLLVVGGVALWIRAEGSPPTIAVPEAIVVGRAGAEVEVAVADPDAGLRSLDVSVRHAKGEIPLLSETYPGNLISGGVRSEQSAPISLDPQALGGIEGDAVLVVRSRDWSWRDWLSGNESLVEIPFTIDLEPPRLSVASGLTYVRQGGTGAVNYSVSEQTEFDGVQVGEHLFRGYPLPGGDQRVALFAIPPEGASGKPQVIARDAAGNQSSAGWPVVVQPKAQPVGKVNLPQSFLENVVPRLAGGDAPSDPAAAFDDVNTRLRAQNEAKIRELVRESSTTPHFTGALDQLRNSQVTSRFAEKRTYLVEGRPVSKATHYGYDLAATAATPITAAEAGRVIWADDLGIYGNCVLIDHGLGVASLYGHLSRIDAKPGEEVRKGQTLGLSGATGLAGGDHLHFAVLVGDTYVDPLEWWDGKWVQTHVMERLGPPAP